MPGHERRAGDDEAEGDEASADLERARADRFVEDEDAADDRGEIGRHGGEGDHLDGRTDLEAAGGREEGDRARDQRRERPRAQQPVQRTLSMREELDRDVRDAEQRPGTKAEQQPLGAAQDAAVGRDRQERGGDGDDRALDCDQLPPAMTAAAVWRRRR